MSTILLTDEIQKRLHHAAALRGLDVQAYTTALVEASLEADLQEFEDTCAAIARGLSQAESGNLLAWESLSEERRLAREARRKARESSNGVP
jgi:predicted transcriptional regulator